MGYELTRFIGEIDEELKCPICTMVLDEPMQTPCEHLFCRECIQEWVAVDRSCPVDRLSLASDSLKPPARYLRNMLGKLDMKCDFVSNGCQTVVKFEYLHNHIANCEYNPNSEIICDMGCNLKMIRREYQVGNCFTHLAERVVRQDEQIFKLNDALSGQQKHVELTMNHLQEQIAKLEKEVRIQHEQHLAKFSNEVCNTQKQITNLNDNQQEGEVANLSSRSQQAIRKPNELLNIVTLINRQQKEIRGVSDNPNVLLMPKWQKCRNIIVSVDEPNILELCLAKEISSFAQSFYSLEPGNCFKIEVLNQGDNNSIGIGLTSKQNPFNFYGYDSYNIVYYNVGSVEYIEKNIVNDRAGPKWKDGDCIECGILSILRDFATVYFSRNGEVVKRKRVKAPSGGFFPTIFMKRYDGLITKVKIWFQNRRTKWKKHDNITNVEAAEHKTSPSKVASTKLVQPNPISFDSTTQTSSIKKSTSKPSNPVTAELNAKLTAKHNNKLKNLKMFANTKNEKFNIVDVKATNFVVPEKTRENMKDNLIIDGTNDVEPKFPSSKISVISHKGKSGYL